MRVFYYLNCPKQSLLLSNILKILNVLARFLFRLSKNDGPCFNLHKFYFLNMSLYRQKIDKVVRKKYNMLNILENDIDGIVSRISFIQHREPFSMYIP